MRAGQHRAACSCTHSLRRLVDPIFAPAFVARCCTGKFARKPLRQFSCAISSLPRARADFAPQVVERLQHENELKDLQNTPIEEDVSMAYEEVEALKNKNKAKEAELARLKLELERMQV
eukprot:6190312-Pleurochrysis_carterae.AAC.1